MQAKLSLYEYDIITKALMGARRIIDLGNGTWTIGLVEEPTPYIAPMTILVSSCLQRFLEEIFWEASQQIFKLSDVQKKDFESSHGRWSNPSVDAVNNKLNRIGIFDIFTVESGMDNAASHKLFLTRLNNIRNDVAHGRLDENYTLVADEIFPFSFEIIREKTVQLSIDISVFLEREIDRLTR